MWAACSTARTNATNSCLWLPNFLCYHFLLHSITRWREAEPVRPMCNSATYRVCPVNSLLTCCFPFHHFPATGRVYDWSLYDAVPPPLSDFSWDHIFEQMVHTGGISPSNGIERYYPPDKSSWCSQWNEIFIFIFPKRWFTGTSCCSGIGRITKTPIFSCCYQSNTFDDFTIVVKIMLEIRKYWCHAPKFLDCDNIP